MWTLTYLTLTVLADLLYRRLAERLKGFGRTSPSKLFRKFVDMPADIQITAKEVVVRLSKRVHNPLLKEAGLMEPTQPVPLAKRAVSASRVPLRPGNLGHPYLNIWRPSRESMRATWVSIRQVERPRKSALDGSMDRLATTGHRVTSAPAYSLPIPVNMKI